MRDTIWRYTLPLGGAPHITMPAGAEVLSVAAGRDGAHLVEVWARADPIAAADEEREFRIVGTGHPIPTGTGRFLGSVQFAAGALVFHVFEAAR